MAVARPCARSGTHEAMFASIDTIVPWTDHRPSVQIEWVRLRAPSSLNDLGGVADSFVCGSADFVEAASALLLQAGQPVDAIRTERFGPTRTSRVDRP